MPERDPFEGLDAPAQVDVDPFEGLDAPVSVATSSPEAVASPAPVNTPAPAPAPAVTTPPAPPKPAPNPQSRPSSIGQGLGMLGENLVESYFPTPQAGPTPGDVQAARTTAIETLKRISPTYMKLHPVARELVLDRFMRDTKLGMTPEQMESYARGADAQSRSRAETFGGSLVSGAIQTTGDIVKGVEVIPKALGFEPGAGDEIARTGEAFRQSTVNPDQRYTAGVGSGVGSTLPFLAGGVAARSLGATGAAATAATAGMGAAAGAGSAYDTAKEAGADGVETFTFTLVGAGLGATEAIPINRALKRFDGITGGLFGQTMKKYVGRPAKDAFNGAIEEVAQELVQTYGTNLAEQMILGLEKDLTDGVGDAIVGAGPVGFLMSGASGVARNLKLRAKAEKIREERTRAQAQELAKTVEQAPVTPAPADAGIPDLTPTGTEFDAPPELWREPAKRKPKAETPQAEQVNPPDKAESLPDKETNPPDSGQVASVEPVEPEPVAPTIRESQTVQPEPTTEQSSEVQPDPTGKDGLQVQPEPVIRESQITEPVAPVVEEPLTTQPDGQTPSVEHEPLTREAFAPAGITDLVLDKPREYFRRTEDGFVPVPDAQPLTIPGYEFADLFISRNEDGAYRITEAKTGVLAATGSTEQEAISYFTSKAPSDPARFDAFVRPQIENRGHSPRYRRAAQPASTQVDPVIPIDQTTALPDNVSAQGDLPNDGSRPNDVNDEGPDSRRAPGSPEQSQADAGVLPGGVPGDRAGQGGAGQSERIGDGDGGRPDQTVGGVEVDPAQREGEGYAPARGEDSGRQPGGVQGGPSSGALESVTSATPEPSTVDLPNLDDSGKPARQQKPKGANYVIPPGTEIAPSGIREKYNANIAAIRLLREIEASGQPATPDQQQILSRYSGWGWAGEYFNANNPRYERQYQELKELLSPEEFRSAQTSTINAHYTSPQVIGPMWDMVRRLGFKGGVVMEPSMGTGNYFGLMPRDIADNSSLFGVELDNLTARIAKQLYPNADIRNESFGDSVVANNSVDLAISNVPFGNISNIGLDYPNLLIHDYFFMRSIDKVRPGGLIAFVTSDGTMNKIDSRVRSMIAERADLVAAFRLPNDAFAQNAGTEVTTDIIILRKKDGTPFPKQDFADVVSVGNATVRERDGREVEKQIMVNEYFKANPDNALGRHTLEGTMYSAGDYALVSRPGQDTGRLLRERVNSLPENIIGQAVTAESFIGQDSLADAMSKEGSYVIKDGVFKEVRDRQLVEPDWLTNKLIGEDWDAPITPEERLRRISVAQDWIRLRDLLVDLSNYERRQDATDKEIARRRVALNRVYDAFVKKHNSTLNHPTQEWRNIAAFLRDDPEYELVQSLEDFETFERTGKNGKIQTVKRWVKSDIFTKRFNKPIEIPRKAESIQDALSISMGFMGKVDPDYMGQLLGKTPDAIRQELLGSDRVFEDPASGALMLKDQYLAGPVVARLEEARQAAKSNPAYDRNVKALEAVQPERINVGDISFSISSRWVPGEVVSEWIKDTTGASVRVQYQPKANAYIVEVNETSAGFSDLAVLSETGREVMSAVNTLRHALSGGDKPKIYKPDPTDPEKSVVDPVATEQVSNKIDQIGERFESWARQTDRTIKDKSVQGLLEDAFNARFNVWRELRVDGDYLILPGNTVTLRKHQRDAVARNIQLREGVNAHGVGSGKTFTLITTAMELRRLGLARRPMIVVQRPTIGQFAVSFRKAYPNAKILVADEKSLSAKKRRKFLARLAMNDYDAVIVTHPQFDRIKPGEDAISAYYNRLISELEEVIDQARKAEGKDSMTTKALVTRRKALEDRLKKSIESAKKRADDIVSFEQLGIDALLIDEAHNYKKIPIVTRKTRIKGIPTEESQKAVALDIKAQSIQARNGGKNVILATGTPLTNSMAEAYVMLKISAPKILERFGIGNFDEFANTFGRINEAVEFTWAGAYKSVQRFNKFINGPELVQMIRAAFDVKIGNAELGIKVPKVKGGKAEIVVVPQDETTAKVTNWLQDVADAYEKSSNKKALSYVPITTMGAGIAAALDPRLIDPTLPEPKNGKVQAVTDRVFKHWQESADSLGTQMIFADRYAPMKVNKLLDVVEAPDKAASIELDEDAIDPDMTAEEEEAAEEKDKEAREKAEQEEYKNAKFNLYKEMKRKLVEKGIPEDQVAIIHEYNTDKKRDALFEAMREGKVRVLIGSTDKMGVGVDVAKRMVALHHMDPPRSMTPAMMEQRDGRIIRQGNMNDEVSIYKYGTEKSMDVGIYQLLENKQVFITQALKGKIAGREFDDAADEVSLSMQEIRAALAGDDRVIKQADLTAKVRALESQRRSHEAEISGRRSRIDTLRRDIAQATASLPGEKATREKLAKAFAGESLELKIGSKTFTERKAIVSAIDSAFQQLESYAGGPTARKGASFDAQVVVNGIAFKLATERAFTDELKFNRTYSLADGRPALWTNTAGGEGMVRSVVNIVERADRLIEETQTRITEGGKRIEVLRRDLNAPFAGAADLAKAREELAALNKDLVDRPVARPERTGGPYSPPRSEEAQPAAEAAVAPKGKPRRGGRRQFSTGQMPPGIQSGLLAPNGKPSNLTPEQYRQVRTPEFKRWFGDWENDPKNASKVVDENGEPLAVYHGSIKEFTSFDPSASPRNRNGNPAGFYYTPDASEAGDYTMDWSKDEPEVITGGNIVPVFLNVRNPFNYSGSSLFPKTPVNQAMVVKFEEELTKANTNVGKDWIKDKVRAFEVKGKAGGDPFPGISFSPQSKTAVLQSGGYDGMRDGRHWITFSPTQIKSAIGNTGTFDPKNSDIRFSPSRTVEDRIPVAPLPSTPDANQPKLSELTTGWGKRFGGYIRAGKSPRGTTGFYDPTNTDTVIRNAGDLNTALHEIAHAIDDQEGISVSLTRRSKSGSILLNDAAKAMKDELSGLWFKGGAGYFGRTAKNDYKTAEAFAVWATDYMLNPEQTLKTYPQVSAAFLRLIPDSVLKDMQDTSTEARTLAGRDALERIKANIKFEPSERLSMFGRMTRALKGSGLEFETSGLDYLKSWLTDSLAPVMSGIKAAKLWTGNDTLPPSKDPQVLMRLWAGQDDQFSDQIDNGPLDWGAWIGGKFSRFDGIGGLPWLFGATDTQTEESIRQDVEDTTAFMIAQRTIERGDVLDKRSHKMLVEQVQAEIRKIERKAEESTEVSEVESLIEQADYLRAVVSESLRPEKPGDRLIVLAENLDADDPIRAAAQREIDRNNLLKQRISGIGAGLESDQATAAAAIKIVESWDAKKKARITESARRYRAWADAMVLQPLLQLGRINLEQYLAIKDDNQFYARMSRTMEEIGLPVPSTSKRLGSVAQPIRSFKGGTDMIENPYTTLMQSAYVAQREAQRNYAMRSFVDLLISERSFNDGDPVPLAQIGRKVQSGDTNAIKVYREGKAEYWQFEQGIHDALKNWGEIGDGNFLLRSVQLVMARIPRALITYAPPFLARNIIRDSVQRSVVSREGSKPWDILQKVGAKDRSMFALSGAGQAGYYASGPGEYYAKLQEHIGDLAKDKKTTILGLGKKALNLYLAMAAESERVGRLAEFKRAYANATKAGYSDVDAMLYAGYRSRELTDFAVAGTVVGQISKYVIFTNAAVQGLRATFNSARSNPAGFATRFAVYVLAPTLAVYGWNAAGGEDDEEEYLNLPSWQRDFFWNFKVADNQWIRIPKPFELGALASGAERLIDAARGKPGAFEGYANSLVGALLPVNEGTFAGPFKPIVETISNYDFFRQRNIVSQYEVGLDVSRREGTKFASALGRLVQAASLDTVDARNADHFIRGQFGIVGDLAMKTSQAVEGQRSPKDVALAFVGMSANSPATGSRVVQHVLDTAMQKGKSGATPVRTLRTLLKKVAEAETDSERDAAAKRARAYAERITPWVDGLE